MFGFDDLLGLATTQVSHEADQNRSHSDMMEGMQFNADSAAAAYERQKDLATTAYNRQLDFSGTAYQRTIADMKAAGINPMMAAMHGPTNAPSVSTPETPSANISPHTTYGGGPTEAHSASTMLALSQANKLDAETRNIDADTANKPLQGNTLKQQVNESIDKAALYRQEAKTSATTAAMQEQQTTNARETLTQIRMTIQNLVAQADNTRANTAETNQRLKEDLPRLRAIYDKLENSMREMEKEGASTHAAAQQSFIGQLGAYINQIQGIIPFIGGAAVGNALRKPTTVNKGPTNIYNQGR